MNEELIIAGFGGQGILSIGQVLAYAGMNEKRYVSWLPSYGPEMRGGTANCNVVISSNSIASPVVTKPTSAIIMNQPSIEKFEPIVRAGGQIFLNASIVKTETCRCDVDYIEIPANDIALEVGNVRVANMVMLGAYLELSKVVSLKNIVSSFMQVFGHRKSHLFSMNVMALEAGMNFVK